MENCSIPDFTRTGRIGRFGPHADENDPDICNRGLRPLYMFYTRIS